jgi:hypothetical protein
VRKNSSQSSCRDTGHQELNRGRSSERSLQSEAKETLGPRLTCFTTGTRVHILTQKTVDTDQGRGSTVVFTFPKSVKI